MKAKESLLHKNLRAVVQTSVEKKPMNRVLCFGIISLTGRKASDKFSGEK